MTKTLLIENGTIVTMDADRRILDTGYVLVENGRITAIGDGIFNAPAEAERIDARGMVVMPGLIDTHAHAGHMLTKGLGGDSEDWMTITGRIYAEATDPEFWAAAACHSGDMGFELMFIGEFPGVLRALSPYDMNIRAWLDNFFSKPKQKSGDLHTLLRLELEWLDREEGDLARLSDEKVGVYCELLEEQVEELQAEIQDVPFSPRFAAVARFARPFGQGPQSVESILLSIRRLSESLRRFRDDLAGPRSREHLRRLAGSGLRPDRARRLLRARARAAELPLEPVLLQRARRRLQRADGRVCHDRSDAKRPGLRLQRGLRDRLDAQQQRVQGRRLLLRREVAGRHEPAHPVVRPRLRARR